MFDSSTLIFVTGANGGFGMAICRAMADAVNLEKSRFVLICRNEASKTSLIASTIFQHIKNQASIVLFDFDELDLDILGKQLKCEMTDAAVVRPIESVFVYHNHGSIGGSDAAHLTGGKSINSYFRTNLSSVIWLNSVIHEEAARLDARLTVINVSSLAAIKPIPFWSLYCTGKAARDMFFKCYAQENDVRVLNYAPGPMDTKLVRDALKVAPFTFKESDYVNCFDSACKLVAILKENTFASGSHIDYFDL